MKKILILLLVLTLVVGAAHAEDARVIDDASLFTTDEIAVMEDLIGHIQKFYQMDTCVLTTTDTPKTDNDSLLVDYADSYYEDNGMGLGDERSGMLVMIDMTNYYLYISTAGNTIDCLTDARLDNLIDSATALIRTEGYGIAMISLLHQFCVYAQLGVPEGAYRYSVD